MGISFTEFPYFPLLFFGSMESFLGKFGGGKIMGKNKFCFVKKIRENRNSRFSKKYSRDVFCIESFLNYLLSH